MDTDVDPLVPPPSFLEVGRESHVAIGVSIVRWSPVSHLPAIAYSSGELSVLKNHLKRAWNRRSTCGEILDLCWSPDGRFLCAAYANGNVRWICSATGDQRGVFSTACTGTVLCIVSCAVDAEVALWFIVMSSGFVYLFGNCLTNLGTLNLRSVPGGLSRCISGTLVGASALSDCTLALIYQNGVDLTLCTLALPITAKLQSLSAIVKVNEVCSGLLRDIDACVTGMQESWQDVISDLDQKFKKLAKERFMMNGDSGTIGDDMLRLLAMGVTSKDFEIFLLHDLGERGVKDLHKDVSTVYSKLRQEAGTKLVSLTFDLCQALTALSNGLAISDDLCKVYDKKSLHSCIRSVCALRSKAFELADRTDLGMREMDRFLSWLSLCIFKLSNPENERPDPFALLADYQFNESDENDVNCLVKLIEDNFVKNWSDVQDDGEHMVKFEHVGQYLKNEKLVTQAKASSWSGFLASKPGLLERVQESTVLECRNPETSLLQDHAALKDSLCDIAGNTFKFCYVLSKTGNVAAFEQFEAGELGNVSFFSVADEQFVAVFNKTDTSISVFELKKGTVHPHSKINIGTASPEKDGTRVKVFHPVHVCPIIVGNLMGSGSSVLAVLAKSQGQNASFSIEFHKFNPDENGTASGVGVSLSRWFPFERVVVVHTYMIYLECTSYVFSST